MQKYRFRIEDQGVPRRSLGIILSTAEDDDEAIRMGHVLADYALLSGSDSIVISITNVGGRDVALIQEGKGDERYLDRPVKYGSGYKKACSSR